MVTGCPSEIRKSLYGSGGACWKTHYRQKLTVGTWAVMAVIYYIAMISHQGLIRIFPRVKIEQKSIVEGQFNNEWNVLTFGMSASKPVLNTIGVTV
nr:hypothetical protein BC354_15265 [Vibrio cholerae]RGP93080.1 hypothetical protein BC352_17460 [Vibrio cholerae]